uniref:Uncharacterized protein n=1 Tax=Romanomermis culicivorax TaxID=13658 RepID=A0A915I024_ROMCU
MTELIITFLLDSWGLPFPNLAIDKLKKAERLLQGQTLPHLNIDGRPAFLRSRLRRLEAIAFSITNTPPNDDDTVGQNESGDAREI